MISSIDALESLVYSFIFEPVATVASVVVVSKTTEINRFIFVPFLLVK